MSTDSVGRAGQGSVWDAEVAWTAWTRDAVALRRFRALPADPPAELASVVEPVEVGGRLADWRIATPQLLGVSSARAREVFAAFRTWREGFEERSVLGRVGMLEWLRGHGLRIPVEPAAPSVLAHLGRAELDELLDSYAAARSSIRGGKSESWAIVGSDRMVKTGFPLDADLRLQGTLVELFVSPAGVRIAWSGGDGLLTGWEPDGAKLAATIDGRVQLLDTYEAGQLMELTGAHPRAAVVKVPASAVLATPIVHLKEIAEAALRGGQAVTLVKGGRYGLNMPMDAADTP